MSSLVWHYLEVVVCLEIAKSSGQSVLDQPGSGFG